MAYTEAGKRAVAKYSAKAYDSILLRVKKGEREKIQAHAESKGLSLNKYIQQLIEQDMGKMD
ncbi:MAG: toxin-antitoxin system HicB family antitoxin [Oscillospiraceae bacterium]|nr:toxin-antitoxin system HicB family antitoxin [Oscillospiraceae bacterium]